MGILTKKKLSDDLHRCSGEVTIDNRNGLHARPAAMFVKISSRYRAEVWVEKDGERVNGKSIMGLMMLAAGKGSKSIAWRASGSSTTPISNWCVATKSAI